MKSKKYLCTIYASLVLSATVLSLRVAPLGTAGARPYPTSRAPWQNLATTSALRMYGQLPLGFEINQGQTEAGVKFLARGHGYTLFLTSTEVALVFTKAQQTSLDERQTGKGKLEKARNTMAAVLRMAFVGANPTPAAVGIQELPGKSNYLRGKDPRRWHANIPRYAQVQFQEVYPGVDLVYHGSQRQLEYDFVVGPGADPSAIRLAFQGIDKLSLDQAGHLVLQTGTGEIRQNTPLIYQEIDGTKRAVSGSYALYGKNQVGFQVGSYDPAHTLVIDPVLSYSTYLGGSDVDEGLGIAVGGSGNVYVTGSTASLNFPTANSLQPSLNGGSNAFVTVFDRTGSTLLYSTYLGGSSEDEGLGIAVDASGNAYVTGGTSSSDFPVTPGAFQTTFGGGICSFGFPCPDAFVAKLDPTGSRLIYATYLGGSDKDEGFAIAVNSSGNAYVAGSTVSTNFPTTPGAFQPAFAGGNADAFVSVLDPTGSFQVYSTYLGGSDRDEALGIAVDASGNAYVSGDTNSTNFPTTPGAFRTSLGGGTCSGRPCPDAFVTKLDPTGLPVYSTYLGGNNEDTASSIAVDSSGNAYVTGSTNSTDFPTTPGAFQPTLGGGTCGIPPDIFACADAFVTKINAAGSDVVYSTYLGGSGDDEGNGISIDSSGNAYIAGSTGSTNFPMVNPLQPAFGGGTSDAFVAKLNATGSGLVYSTYLGGSNKDEATAIAVDSSGAYLTGDTASTNLPTANPFQPAFGGGISDGFVTKVAE